MGRKSEKHKMPEKLRQEIAAQQDQPAAEGQERTAEGEQVRTPGRGEFLGNLEKASEPSRRS